MKARIESVDELCSENQAGRGSSGRMREAASRGFWVASKTPYGYRMVVGQDGAKKRPKWNSMTSRPHRQAHLRGSSYGIQ